MKIRKTTKKDSKEKFEKALNIFVDKTKKNKNVIAILITGSFIHSVPDKNSDLDVYILTKEGKYRERGNTWINGVEVEYFMNPVKQVEQYFIDETKKGGPHTAHMFANSKILFRRGNEIDRLIKKAKSIINKKRNPMDNTSKELAKYFLDDLEKDLEDTYIKNDSFAFNLIANDILKKTLDVFLHISRTYEEKHKRLYNYLSSKDNKFASLYKKTLLETNMKKRYTLLIKLVRFIETKIDGKRTKE